MISVPGALAGSCRGVTNATSRRLYSPTWGLYVPCGVHVDLEDFAPGTVVLVLCSEHFDREDYVPASCCSYTAEGVEVVVCAC